MLSNYHSKAMITWNIYTHESVKELVAYLCPTLCDPMDCNWPRFSVHGIFQEGILERVAIPFSRGSSQPSDHTQASYIAGRFFTISATREVITPILHPKLKIIKLTLWKSTKEGHKGQSWSHLSASEILCFYLVLYLSKPSSILA